MLYDVGIVGAGITGCTLARFLAEAGKSVIMFEKSEVGGHCATGTKNNFWGREIEVHKHGPHIWHNSDPEVQQFMDRFANFKPFKYTMFSFVDGKLHHFPITIDTFREVDPEITAEEINNRKLSADESSFESYLVSILGEEIYQKFYYGYTLKQWGTTDLPVSVAKRIPIRSNRDTTYWHDAYQALPDNYNKMFYRMLEHPKIELHEESEIALYNMFGSQTIKIWVYTGSLDELLSYKFGSLSYRTLKHQDVTYNYPYYLPCAVINYPDPFWPHTRLIEHKHFNNHNFDPYTIVTWETPVDWERGMVRYYPMWDQNKYNFYVNELRSHYPQIIPAGRLGMYKYLDMNQAVRYALDIGKALC